MPQLTRWDEKELVVAKAQDLGFFALGRRQSSQIAPPCFSVLGLRQPKPQPHFRSQRQQAIHGSWPVLRRGVNAQIVFPLNIGRLNGQKAADSGNSAGFGTDACGETVRLPIRGLREGVIITVAVIEKLVLADKVFRSDAMTNNLSRLAGSDFRLSGHKSPRIAGRRVVQAFANFCNAVVSASFITPLSDWVRPMPITALRFSPDKSVLMLGAIRSGF